MAARHENPGRTTEAYAGISFRYLPASRERKPRPQPRFRPLHPADPASHGRGGHRIVRLSIVLPLRSRQSLPADALDVTFLVASDFTTAPAGGAVCCNRSQGNQEEGPCRTEGSGPGRTHRVTGPQVFVNRLATEDELGKRYPITTRPGRGFFFFFYVFFFFGWSDQGGPPSDAGSRRRRRASWGAVVSPELGRATTMTGSRRESPARAAGRRPGPPRLRARRPPDGHPATGFGASGCASCASARPENAAVRRVAGRSSRTPNEWAGGRDGAAGSHRPRSRPGPRRHRGTAFAPRRAATKLGGRSLRAPTGIVRRRRA